MHDPINILIAQSRTISNLHNITGRNAMTQMGVHHSRNSSSRCFTVPPAVSFTPAVTFCARVSAWMKPSLGRDSSVTVSGHAQGETAPVSPISIAYSSLENPYTRTIEFVQLLQWLYPRRAEPPLPLNNLIMHFYIELIP